MLLRFPFSIKDNVAQGCHADPRSAKTKMAAACGSQDNNGEWRANRRTFPPGAESTSSRQHRLLQQRPLLFLPAPPPTRGTVMRTRTREHGEQTMRGAAAERKTMSYKNLISEQLSWSRSPEESTEDLTDFGVFRALPHPLPTGVLSPEYCRMCHVTS